MKRVMIVFLIAILLVVGCGGNVSSVKRQIGESDIYSQADVEMAMDVVVAHFSENFEGCELIDLWYEEEFSAEQAEEWAAQYEAEQAIVLLSNFKVDGSGGDGSLNPNSTYTDWMWILVRDEGDWELKTWGY